MNSWSVPAKKRRSKPMQPSALFAMMIVAAAGVTLAVQAPLNAALGRAVSSPIAAATISFAVGFAVLLVCTFLLGEARAFLVLPSAPLWLLMGGALGAFYVFSALWSVPILGVLTTTSLLILGQIIAALIIDHFGAFGLASRDISTWRILSGVFVAIGVVLSRF